MSRLSLFFGNPRRWAWGLGVVLPLSVAVALRASAHDVVTARVRAPAGRRNAVPATPIRRQLEARLDSLAVALERLDTSLAANQREEARAAFRDARALYKRSELLIAFYGPTLASLLNGPAEADDPDAPAQRLGRRAAFGVVERALFGGAVSRGRIAVLSDARVAAASMVQAVQSFRTATPLLDVSDSAALDAARLELARVSTVGIAGFDSDESGDAIRESAAAIDGVADAIGLLRSARLDAAGRQRTIAGLRAASAALSANVAFDSADRFDFIADHVIPTAKSLLALRIAVDAAPSASRRLWRSTSASPFDSGAFDVSALAPEYAPPSSAALVALGAKMFGDRNLSGNRARSCASCHQQSRAFTDGSARASASAGVADLGLRNTPTLLNAALQPALFADQRAGFVEDQIRVVLTSPAEMGSSPEIAGHRIGTDSSYRPLVRRVTGRPAPVDERLVRVALAAYVRSLTALNSPFDRAIRGDASSLTDGARRGFNIFMGKARCGTCHFAPMFGGTMAPDFVRSELEIIGVPAVRAARRARVDVDSGRAAVDGAAEHRGAFRVPSVRNSAVTAPYMHNGVYRTLDEVIDFYNRGGGAGIGEQLPSQTLDPRPLHLSARERGDLVAFLRSITDTVVAVAKP